MSSFAEKSLPKSISQIDTIDATIDCWWEKHFRDRPIFDRIFYLASESANFSLLWYVIGIVQAINRQRSRSAVELGVALFLESLLVNGLLKSLFMRSRPPSRQNRPHTLRQPLTSSFPSGHASAAMLAAALISRKSQWNPMWYLLAFVVALSRIHTQLHHTSDVIAGIALGLASGAIIRKLLAKQQR